MKQWLYRFLPLWAKETLLDENRRLKARLSRAEAEIERLNAYIDGLETAMRARQKIVIGGGKT